MLVQDLLVGARARLVTIPEDAPLIEAAKLLRPGTDLLVVCGANGVIAGVISKTDVVAQISHCQGCSCVTAASLAMSRKVVLCRPGDALEDAWSRMKEHGLKNIPISNEHNHPVGILNARDALQFLLKEVQYAEVLLREYVMGVGYH